MKTEKLFIIGIAAAALFIINAPIIYFYNTDNTDLLFLGRRVANNEDTYRYVSFIEQAKQNRNLFENLYTTEPQEPNLLRPSYQVIGKLARAFNVSSIAAYHVSRIILSLLFYFVLFRFITLFFDDSIKRVAAFFTVSLASGFGTIDWIPGAVTFLSLGEAPHFILSQVLLLIGLYFLLTEHLYILAPLPLFFLSLERPCYVLVIAPTVLVSFVWSKKGFVKGMLPALLSSPGIIYRFVELRTNPAFASWQAQNALISPSPNDYLLGFGLLVPLAILGVESFTKEESLKHKLILSWVFMTAAMIYAPVSFQRSMVEGVHIPVAILAAVGLSVLSKTRKRLAIVVLVLLPVFSILSIYKDMRAIGDPSNRHYFFMDRDEYEAVSWLGSHTTDKDVILANTDYGNLIPGFVARKTYIGHSIQTINLSGKIELVNSFLLEKNALIAWSFLYSNKITHIFLGKNDAMARYGFHPQTLDFLTVVYSKKGVRIYGVGAAQPGKNQRTSQKTSHRLSGGPARL
jgi:hypothetical protein